MLTPPSTLCRTQATAAQLGATAAPSNGNFIAHPFAGPVIGGERRLLNATCLAPGAPRSLLLGLRYHINPQRLKALRACAVDLQDLAPSAAAGHHAHLPARHAQQFRHEPHQRLIGGPFHRRGGQPHLHVPVVHPDQLIASCPGLHIDA